MVFEAEPAADARRPEGLAIGERGAIGRRIAEAVNNVEGAGEGGAGGDSGGLSGGGRLHGHPIVGDGGGDASEEAALEGLCIPNGGAVADLLDDGEGTQPPCDRLGDLS